MSMCTLRYITINYRNRLTGLPEEKRLLCDLGETKDEVHFMFCDI